MLITAMAGQGGETTNPILPATNETVWWVVSALVLLLFFAAVLLAVRYVVRLRRERG